MLCLLALWEAAAPYVIEAYGPAVVGRSRLLNPRKVRKGFRTETLSGVEDVKPRTDFPKGEGKAQAPKGELGLSRCQRQKLPKAEAPKGEQAGQPSRRGLADLEQPIHLRPTSRA